MIHIFQLLTDHHIMKLSKYPLLILATIYWHQSLHIIPFTNRGGDVANIADPVSLQEASNYSQEDLARTYILAFTRTCIHVWMHTWLNAYMYIHENSYRCTLLLFDYYSYMYVLQMHTFLSQDISSHINRSIHVSKIFIFISICFFL